MLSVEAPKEIDRAVARCPADRKQSVVMVVLAVTQSEKSWVSPEITQFVAEYLEIPPVWVEGVATLYNMYDIKPVGRFKLSVCTSSPCVLSDGERIADYLKKRLGIGLNETTADGNFTLKEGERMGACGDAPVMIVSSTRMYSFTSNERLGALIADPQSKVPTDGAGK